MFLNVKDFSANALFSVSARNAFWVKSALNVVEQCMMSIKCVLKVVVHFTVCWQNLVFFHHIYYGLVVCRPAWHF